MGNKAKCPYCGSSEFLPQNDAANEPIEVVCAACGGHASRQILLEWLTENAESGGIMHSEKDLMPPLSAFSVSQDRKSTPLNSSHTVISYGVVRLKKKTA